MVRRLIGLYILCVLCGSCASNEYNVPEPFASQVDRSLSFHEVEQSPQSYIGKVIVVGGEVLMPSASRRALSSKCWSFLSRKDGLLERGQPLKAAS